VVNRGTLEAMLQRCLLFVIAAALLAGARTQSPTQPSPDLPPLLTPSQMAQQTIECKPRKIDRGVLSKGTVVPARITVNESGDIVDFNFVDRCPVGCGRLASAILSVKRCKFRPYIVDGKAITYRGDVQLTAP
jgi:hypothetical protein